jgi:hypothetical protein
VSIDARLKKLERQHPPVDDDTVNMMVDRIRMFDYEAFFELSARFALEHPPEEWPELYQRHPLPEPFPVDPRVLAAEAEMEPIIAAAKARVQARVEAGEL